MTQSLVVGGAGFIGTHLLRHLKAQGAERLVSVDIAPPQNPVEGVAYETHDIRQPFPERLDAPFDAIYNLAAVHRTPGHEPHEYYETNLGGRSACATSPAATACAASSSPAPSRCTGRRRT